MINCNRIISKEKEKLINNRWQNIYRHSNIILDIKRSIFLKLLKIH